MRRIFARAIERFKQTDISIFHEFHRPPYGGGNQFLLALRSEFQGRGLRVGNNVISRTTRACLFNSFNFDFARLRTSRRAGCAMVHRVDGPIGGYRGEDDGTDRRICEMNHELADITIFQSHYSLEAHKQVGLVFKNPTVILNAVNPNIFYPPPSVDAIEGRKVRLISTSWSQNPNKGATTYKWIEEHLDWDRFEYTFVGRSPIPFNRIHTVPAVPSQELADLLRQHDIYITASLNDPCSNALIEALACGLPALYADSGGHPEIVQEAGFGFAAPDEIPAFLERLVEEYAFRKSEIRIPSLAQVAEQYLKAMGISLQTGHSQ